MENIFWPPLENSTIALQERNFRHPCARNAKFIFPSAGGVGCNMQFEKLPIYEPKLHAI